MSPWIVYGSIWVPMGTTNCQYKENHQVKWTRHVDKLKKLDFDVVTFKEAHIAGFVIRLDSMFNSSSGYQCARYWTDFI